MSFLTDILAGRFLTGNTETPFYPNQQLDYEGQQFLLALENDWREYGQQAIAQFRETNPHAYLEIISAFYPEELNTHAEELPPMTDDEYREIFTTVIQQIRAEVRPRPAVRKQ